MTRLSVSEFTDPACPFAYSAEPARWRLAWRFGDGLDWTVRVVGLARDAAAQEAKGFDAEKNAAVLRNFDQYGMPLTEAGRREPAGTWDACRFVVAARRDDPDAAIRLVRALRVAGLAEARPIDHPDVLADAARTAGLDPEALRARAAEDETERAFRGDLEAARTPGPASIAMDRKLADVEDDWDGAAGPERRRFTCPSYVLETDGGGHAEVPGFQPWPVLEAVVANLAPDLEQRPWAEDPIAALRWAPVPLATVEVAALMDLEDREEARGCLREAGATEHAVGTDAFWSAPER